MHISRRKLGLIVAIASLVIAGGCTGFFVNPTLTSIAVGPTATIQQTKTVNMTATGTNSDGSTKSPLSGVFWSTSDDTIASINSSSGVVTGVAPGSATITGAVGAISGQATITVTLENLSSISITPTTAIITSGNSQQYQAVGKTTSGQTVPITNSVTWAIQAGSVQGVSINTSGLLTSTSSDTGTVTVTATDPATGIVSNTATLTIQ